MGQKTHRNPVDLRLNEEAYNDFLNHLLDSGRFEEAHRLAVKKQRGVLTSQALVELMAFDGEAIGSGIEDEKVKEDSETQSLAQNRLEMEQKIFSDDIVLNTNEVNFDSGPSGNFGAFLGDVIFITSIGNIFPKYKEEKPEEEIEKENLIDSLSELLDMLYEGDITLLDTLEFLQGEVTHLDDFLMGDSYDNNE